MAWRAMEPLTLSLSLTTAVVMSLAFGISFIILSYVALSKATMLESFSLTFPLLHFFLRPRPPAMAAFILASFDFLDNLVRPHGWRAESPRARKYHPAFGAAHRGTMAWAKM